MITSITQPLGQEKDHQLCTAVGCWRITIHGAFRLPCHRRTLGSVGAGVDSELKPVSSLQDNKATHELYHLFLG